MHDNVMPQAREEGLLIEHVDDEAVVYDVETREAHCLKPLAAVVFELCDGRAAVVAAAETASAKVGYPVGIAEIDAALEQLQHCGLLLEPASGTSRREMIRRSAALAGVAASGALISSLAMPGTALAASCNLGANCTHDTDCTPCTNHMICVNGHCDSCKCVSNKCALVLHPATCTGAGSCC